MLLHNANLLPRLRSSPTFKTRHPLLESSVFRIGIALTRSPISAISARYCFPSFPPRQPSVIRYEWRFRGTEVNQSSMSESRVPPPESQSRFESLIRSSCFVKMPHDLTFRVTNRANLMKRKFVGLVGTSQGEIALASYTSTHDNAFASVLRAPSIFRVTPFKCLFIAVYLLPCRTILFCISATVAT